LGPSQSKFLATPVVLVYKKSGLSLVLVLKKWSRSWSWKNRWSWSCYITVFDRVSISKFLLCFHKISNIDLSLLFHYLFTTLPQTPLPTLADGGIVPRLSMCPQTLIGLWQLWVLPP